MCRRIMVGAFLCLAAAAGYGSPPSESSPPKLKLGAAHTHGNLTVFFIHGPNTVGHKTVVTLKEAMEKKIVVVNETSSVNCLSIENTSPDVEVFVMAGDIVKGGKQDRAIAFDMVLPSKSGIVALPSFCVEHGRWQKRGAEATGQFTSSDSQVCSKDLKIAVNESRKQQQVWDEVENAQKKLSANLGKEVKCPTSRSSLQLALEDKDLQAKIGEYEKALAKTCNGHSDIIGVAVAVNGAISCADVFGSAELFQKLWPKLLKSAATEAIADLKADKKYESCKAEAVQKFLDEAATAPAKEVAMNQSGNVPQRGQVINDVPPGRQPQAQPKDLRVRIIQHSAGKTLMVESQDKDKTGLVWHRCYICK